MRENRTQGFTLIELIAVIIVLGILAVVAGPYLSNSSTNTQAGRDDFVAALFYAQQIAMARDSSANAVQLTINSGNQVSVSQTLSPTNLYSVSMPVGISISPANIVLDYSKLGATTQTSFVLTTASGGTTGVELEASGYVHP